MRIESSQLQLNTAYQATSRVTREEQLSVRLPNQNGQMSELHFQQQHSAEQRQLSTYESLATQLGAPSLAAKAETLGQQVDSLNQQHVAANSDTPASSQSALTEAQALDMDAEEEDIFELSPEDRMRITLVKTLLSSITGREIEFSITDLRIRKSSGTASTEPTHKQSSVTPDPPQPATEEQPIAQPPGASLEYHVSERFYQQEMSQFQAKGLVTTQDGQEIEIDIALNMSRELEQHNEFSLRLGAALKDPLVISFDGQAAQLSEERFEFDLTLDGHQESIPMLGQNSAFLALDRNGDGVINDGSELFGAKTGDGFAELAQYDDDGNGWIDENDFIFEHLRLWLKPGQGESQQLISLKDAGIGAIYLGNADTPFTLNNTLGDERLGVIRSTSIYVSDEGKAGLIQHVDLSI